MRINDVLAGKASQQVVTIAPTATVRELVTMLAQHNVGALVVSSDGIAVDGIVSERDVVRHLGNDESVLNGQVSTIMTAQVHTVVPSEALHELMQLMTDQRIRHVPVVVDGALTGIISIGDVVKSRIGELEFERDQIESYVQSQQT